MRGIRSPLVLAALVLIALAPGGVLAQECAAPLEAFFARQRLG